MKIYTLKEFDEGYDKLPLKIKLKVEKALELMADIRHPSLRIKKLKDYEDLWYGRIDINYRFTFQLIGDEIILRRVGQHNSVLDKP